MQQYSIMGIVNLTDNSFVGSSRMADLPVDEIVSRVGGMITSGAGIIDVGACSSAPGNACVGEAEEWSRLNRVLPALFSSFPDMSFSIDTFRPSVVKKALLFGKEFIVNDIFASDATGDMISLVAAQGLRYIAMDSSEDPYRFFGDFAERAEKNGLKDWILDPGFGFGKTLERNWEIMNGLERFKDFGKEILVSISRKRMIYIPNGLTPETCALQSVAAEKLAVSKGASIIRTHDVSLHSKDIDHNQFFIA